MEVEELWMGQENRMYAFEEMTIHVRTKPNWKGTDAGHELPRQTSYFPGKVEMQDQRRAEYQQMRKNIQDRMPLGLRIKVALKDFSACHGKRHRKQQAWVDQKREQ